MKAVTTCEITIVMCQPLPYAIVCLGPIHVVEVLHSMFPRVMNSYLLVCMLKSNLFPSLLHRNQIRANFCQNGKICKPCTLEALLRHFPLSRIQSDPLVFLLLYPSEPGENWSVIRKNDYRRFSRTFIFPLLFST